MRQAFIFLKFKLGPRVYQVIVYALSTVFNLAQRILQHFVIAYKIVIAIVDKDGDQDAILLQFIVVVVILTKQCRGKVTTKGNLDK